MDKVEERLGLAFGESMDKMSSMVESLVANQKVLQTSTSILSETAETFKKLMLDMSNNVKAAMETSDSLTNMVTSYKEVLLKSNLQQNQQDQVTHNIADPKILRDINRKSKQILINTVDPKTLGSSLVEIKDKVSAAIKDITDPPPLQTQLPLK
ncbi:hypothetical protein EI94DRAFT_1811709 [Lactarius quietus]|nr:hypothetical protein EI94DRAFT_1811709 [Lactarius quietus]